MTSGPPLTPGTLAVPVGDETVVWVEATGALHLLDPVAAGLLDLLLAGTAQDGLVAAAVAASGAPADVVARDVAALLDRLVALQVLA